MDLKTLKSDLNNWTLASDQKLLDLLQNFSREIDEKASKCCNDVDSLSHDVAETEVCMRNIFNEFLMLGSTQFIENVSFIGTHFLSDTWYREFTTMTMMSKMRVSKSPKRMQAVSRILWSSWKMHLVSVKKLSDFITTMMFIQTKLRYGFTLSLHFLKFCRIFTIFVPCRT